MRISILLTLVLGLLGLALVSCNQEVPTPTIPDGVKDLIAAPSTQDTISKTKFDSYVKAWNDNGIAFSATTLLEYFTMNKIDLTEVLGEKPEKVRFYIGLDMTVTPHEPHLMVVGVDKNGQNMLDYSKNQYAYDLTKPCPKYCPQMTSLSPGK